MTFAPAFTKPPVPFDQALHALPDAILITDATGTDNPIVYVNPAFESLSGFSLAEVVGRNPRFLQGKDTDPQAVAVLHDAVAAAHDCKVVLKNYHKNGGAVWVEITLTPIRDSDGVLSHFVGVHRDVTAERYSECITETQNQLLGNFQRGASLDVVLNTLATRAEVTVPGTMASVMLVDEVTHKLVCIAAPSLPAEYVSSIASLPIAEHVGTCGTAAFRKEAVLSENLATDTDWQGYHALAASAHLQACWSEPMMTSEGEVLGTIAFYQPMPGLPSSEQRELLRLSAEQAALIISRYRSEERWHQISADLEERVKRRTEEAVSANKTKSQFLNAASHDLRQPLQSLRFYLAALNQADHKQDNVALMHKMNQSVDTMSELLDALLDVARLESSSVIAKICDFPVQQVLDKVLAIFTPHALQKHLQLVVEPSSSIVRSDPVLLQRIIENLVSNAIRYTEQGSVTVTCHCDNSLVKLAVSDSGIGIPLAKQEIIFEEFKQLDNEERNRDKGLGLGLAIVKRLGRLLQHPVSVSSVPGQGSSFTVEMPLSLSEVSDVSDVSEPERARIACQPQDYSVPLVLLVDDDEAIVDAMSMVLSMNDIEVRSANSSTEALALISDGLYPDFIISDFRLRGDNGIDTVAALRASLNQRIPCVLMSGDTSGELSSSASVDACTFMRKPVDVDKLIALINTSKQTTH